jgi:hypothetical protein
MLLANTVLSAERFADRKSTQFRPEAVPVV